ncbi:MAG TPA: alpha/beta hydrolase [Acetobacteraceae bacterium]|nr:alpha/beta hydrolase [Acetobacteraceae bacterium]
MTDLSRLVAAPGAHSLPYIDPMFPDRPLVLHAARPRAFTQETPVLLVHHGVGRNGAAYRDYWLKLVDDAGVLAIAIEFSEASFPDYLRYHFGNLRNEDGTPNPRTQWTYGVDERLFLALQQQGVTACRRYGLFGHSAGGQFVHRMLSFGYRDYVAIAICANAGTYAMPDLDIAWPFGLGETELDAPALADLLRFPITVMAGTEDTKTTGRFFPKGPRSMRQGGTRYERAHSYIRSGHHAAQALGTHCAWTVIDVPDVGHDGHGMSIAAAPVIAAALRADVAMNC